MYLFESEFILFSVAQVNRLNLDCYIRRSLLFILSFCLSICFHFYCFFQNFVLFFFF